MRKLLGPRSTQRSTESGSCPGRGGPPCQSSRRPQSDRRSPPSSRCWPGRARLTKSVVLTSGDGCGGAVRAARTGRRTFFSSLSPVWWRAVGEDQTVHAEVAVVGELSKVSAVAIERLAVFHPLNGGVGRTTPDKAAYNGGLPVEQLPVVLQVAGGRCPWRG